MSLSVASVNVQLLWMLLSENNALFSVMIRLTTDWIRMERNPVIGLWIFVTGRLRID